MKNTNHKRNMLTDEEHIHRLIMAINIYREYQADYDTNRNKFDEPPSFRKLVTDVYDAYDSMLESGSLIKIKNN
tara:strand:+ start:7913 stop:8134 length:222 start_codon:yes stop_codon:yes gene_type:complete